MHLAKSSASAAHWSEQQYRSLVLPDAAASTLTLVAQSPENSIIVGFLIARHVAPEWEIENIVVAPETKRKGVGTGLVQELVKQAQQTNSETVFLEVRDSNTAARALYERAGFYEVGRRKSYYLNPLEDAILYCKKL